MVPLPAPEPFRALLGSTNTTSPRGWRLLTAQQISGYLNEHPLLFQPSRLCVTNFLHHIPFVEICAELSVKVQKHCCVLKALHDLVPTPLPSLSEWPFPWLSRAFYFLKYSNCHLAPLSPHMWFLLPETFFLTSFTLAVFIHPSGLSLHVTFPWKPFLRSPNQVVLYIPTFPS